MKLSETWDAYSTGDYLTSLRLSAESLAESASIDLLHIAGLSLMKMRHQEEGLVLLNAAITLRPQSSHIYINAAFIAEQAGRTAAAAAFAEAGLKDFPDEPDLLLLKANSLVMEMRFDEAVPFYTQLLERDPTHVQSMINLGNIARAKDDFDQAHRWFNKAEAIEPDFRDLVFARATMYTQMGDDIKATRILEQLAADVDAQFLLALLYLARGDYARGFRLYRARSHAIWYKAGRFVHPSNPFDHWTEATGKRIAVLQEGGFGDLIQFVRYIPMLAEVAESITMFIPSEMIRLMYHLPANVECRGSYDNFDANTYDYVTTDVEMPYHFRTVVETIPATIPYLSVPEAAITQRQLPATTLKRVGLCWAGGTQDSLNQRSYDYRRSFDLTLYAPLATVPGIEFVSLQMGKRAEQTCPGLSLTRVLDPSFDFLDTAAIIMQLDLVITVDTSVVHLAAALGKPVWLLSRYDGCWRWLKNQSESPWYPGVLRVFGQKRYRDWTEPMADVLTSLQDFVHEN